MSDGFDLSGLDRLAADLNGAGNAVLPFATTAIRGTSMGVKKDWNAALYREGHAKWTGYDVDFDITVKGGAIESEIGPVEGKKQATIVRYLEFGTPTSPPHGGGAGALQKNTDDFVRGLEKAVTDALKSKNL